MMQEQNSFRRHENACCWYRERWVVEDGRRTENGELVLYEVYCLQEMPPETAEEQALCFQRRTYCWRNGELLSSMSKTAHAAR
ncbi:MAG TPA: hypothetical protein VMV93_04800 [Chloroflexota bacterium]|nr:hypothetical protein [Chloroflexota bacterium]